jgi:hypothetical protein
MFVTIHRIPLKSEEEETRERMLTSLVSTGKVISVQYDDIPSSYIKGEWPSKSNLLCANCAYSGNRMPFFIPVGRKGNVFSRGTNPIFCSPACACYVILQVTDSSARNRKLKLIADLMEEMFNVTDIIVPSGNPAILKKFGGTVSDLDYQNKKVIERMYGSKCDLIDELSAA